MKPMQEIEAVLDPSQGLPDWPTEDGVDGAAALLDTGQDEPSNVLSIMDSDREAAQQS